MLAGFTRELVLTMKKITITIEDDDTPDYSRTNMADPFNRQQVPDNGWVGGKDICATCPNRPFGPNNKTGACWCVIPSMYGPGRITC
jgi:hypothetical protein